MWFIAQSSEREGGGSEGGERERGGGVQARTQQGAQRARAPPLATVYSTVEYYDLPWHKRRRNINEHASIVQYKFHVKNAINSLYILSISWPEV